MLVFWYFVIFKYVHLKGVLEYHFGQLMYDIKSKNRNIRYTLNIPQDYETVPLSLIAQTLNNNLLRIKEEFVRNNDSKLNNHLQSMGNSIIYSFQLLYNKYIDARNAILMINIAHGDRHPLAIMLDPVYTHSKRRISARRNGHTHGHGHGRRNINASKKATTGLPTINTGTAFGNNNVYTAANNNNNNNSNNNNNNSVTNYYNFKNSNCKPELKLDAGSDSIDIIDDVASDCGIKRDFSTIISISDWSKCGDKRRIIINGNGIGNGNVKMFDIDSINDGLKEKEIYFDVIGELLVRLMIKMENAVREVSSLMNDSFARFRDNSQTFEQVFHAAQKYFGQIQ